MQTAWHGTVQNFLQAIKEQRLFGELRVGYNSVYGPPSPSEENSWHHSLNCLSQCLAADELANCQIFLEVQMTISAERADVVILGGSPEAIKGVVIELKQWTEVELCPNSIFVKTPNAGEHLHPWYQVCNYAGKFLYFSEIGARIKWQALAYLHNMPPNMLDRLKMHECVQQTARDRLLGKNDSRQLAARLSEWLAPATLKEQESAAFYNSTYSQTHHLFDAITNSYGDILKELSRALPKIGFGLTEEQVRVCEEVLAALRLNETRHFIIDGGAGSGKTLLATILLLQALKQEGKNVVFALRGNRLHAMLKHCFDKVLPGSSGCIQYFSNHGKTGLCDSNQSENYDLIIADESQRLRQSQIKPIIDKGKIVVFFLDEKQRLNPPEEGTAATISRHCIKPTIHRLSRPARCRGGIPYHDWVDRVLEGSANSAVILSKMWAISYRVQIVSSVTELTDQLSELGKSHKTALVASFTESPGDLRNASDLKNRRVGYPLISGADMYRGMNIDLRWLMQPNDYVRFWKDGLSNRLNTIASIYGSQGFESDYIGLIWGRDLLWQADIGLSLGDPQHCYDDIDGLITRQPSKEWHPEAFQLIINRYRIFLTRGILGTVIFCEDDATREYLRSTVAS